MLERAIAQDRDNTRPAKIFAEHEVDVSFQFSVPPVCAPRAEARSAFAEPPKFFFSGPTQTLVCETPGERVFGRLTERQKLADAAEAALRAQPERDVVVAGAVAYDDNTPANLFCSRHATRLSRFWPTPANAAVQNDVRPVEAAQSKPDHSAQQFVEQARAALQAIEEGKLDKVVLARVKDFCFSQRVNIWQVLSRLRARNPHGFIFALGGATENSSVPCRTLVGASPELLLSRRGHLVVSAPLAGSIPRAQDPDEDKRRAQQLLSSAKDLREHRFVVEYILDLLRPLTRTLRFERQPLVTTTGSMWHLSSRIEGELRDLDISSLRLALLLHPTPAVCGVPPQAAAEFIRSTETFERDYFTGTLGYMTANGDGDWVVTIRCAELAANQARLFAGAGIVAGSEPEKELQETSAKMLTMLRALGIEGDI